MKAQISIFVALMASQAVKAFPTAAFNTPEILEGLSRRYSSTVDINDAGLHSRDISLGDLVNGLLNGTLPGVTFPAISLPLGLGEILLEVPPVVAIGRKAIPDEGHPFQEPQATDQRGGCPGLNIMANYGYIDRSGVTNATELLWAQQEMLGLAPDVAAALVGLTAISALDPTSLKLSIGNADVRTNGLLSLVLGQVPGIFDKAVHNAYEVDGSIAYTDSAFTPDGNTNHFNSSKWAQSLQFAKSNGNQFGQSWLAAARYQNYLDCIATNPSCSWGAKQIVFYAAAAFPQTMMASADENGAPTTPTIDAVSTFWGVQDNGDGTFSHVPEKLPPSSDGNWYRRSVPLTAAQLLLTGVEGYLAHPVIFGSNSGEPNTFTGDPDQIGNVTASPHPLCLAFNEIQEFVPGPLKPAQGALIQLSNLLLAPAKLAIGC